MSAANVITLGVDSVEVDRFRDLITRRPSVVSRLFTDDEQAYASRFADPAERLSARFAAKEATMKALGVGIGALGFREVSVVHHDSGAPSLHVTGAAAALAADRGIDEWLVSLTHTSVSAGAVVMGLSK